MHAWTWGERSPGSEVSLQWLSDSTLIVAAAAQRFLEMARNDTSSGAMKLKLCTDTLNGSEGHL